MTAAKLFNYGGLYLSYCLSFFKYVGVGKLSPSFLSFELANGCNLQCPECPIGSSDIPRKIQLFDFELYKRVVEANAHALMTLILYFQGEPFLNPSVFDYIRFAHAKKIFTIVSTNGQLINKKNARKIVDSGLDQLIVSIDGATQQTYAQYRVGGKLDKALDAVRCVAAARKASGCSSPHLIVQCLVLSTNEHEMDDMRQLVLDLGADELQFKSAQLYDFESGNRFMTSVAKFSRYKLIGDGKYVLRKKIKNRCWRLWSGAVVDVDGNLLPCCFDKHSAQSFGNLHDAPLSEVWHNKKASGFRRTILLNRKQYDMCRNCTS